MTAGLGDVALTRGFRVPVPGRLGKTSFGAEEAVTSGAVADAIVDDSVPADAADALKPGGSRLATSATCTLPIMASSPDAFSVEVGASVLSLKPGGRKALISTSWNNVTVAMIRETPPRSSNTFLKFHDSILYLGNGKLFLRRVLPRGLCGCGRLESLGQ